MNLRILSLRNPNPLRLLEHQVFKTDEENHWHIVRRLKDKKGLDLHSRSGVEAQLKLFKTLAILAAMTVGAVGISWLAPVAEAGVR